MVVNEIGKARTTDLVRPAAWDEIKSGKRGSETREKMGVKEWEVGERLGATL